ncbi:hypothetical protein TBLA_0H03610 [Henningerozyma blattae CBS 6284]|uniref:Ndc10 domain-containing protein n=1 Tax=Henningerozyma blattae (strain ATCC 34711 / CBS 6284 / DSM 70876 / NBRC 10599 / NRRL Y-10934 / UCD 77-7) TaxID=1071380 RepID=I2H8E1_HENB6|nr:hypothetical protein TBLA_0H03610 [Tetrapisispora blattae CBS 6284]CCH62643.1 hypothetical protein TBLA_0H03610 [Tetrapisispora blattae CBS 6284]
MDLYQTATNNTNEKTPPGISSSLKSTVENQLRHYLKQQDKLASNFNSPALVSGFSTIVQFLLQYYCNVDLIDVASIKLIDMYTTNKNANMLIVRKTQLTQSTGLVKAEYYQELQRDEDITQCPVFALTMFMFLVWHNPKIPITAQNFESFPLLDPSSIINNIFNPLKSHIYSTPENLTDQNDFLINKKLRFDNNGNNFDKVLSNMVFPWLPKLRSDMKYYHRTNFKLYSFCNLFEFFGRVFIQDCTYLSRSPNIYGNLLHYVQSFFPQFENILHSKSINDTHAGSNTKNVCSSNNFKDELSENKKILDKQIQDTLERNIFLGRAVDDMQNDLSAMKMSCNTMIDLQLKVLNNLQSEQEDNRLQNNKNNSLNSTSVTSENIRKPQESSSLTIPSQTYPSKLNRTDIQATSLTRSSIESQKPKTPPSIDMSGSKSVHILPPIINKTPTAPKNKTDNPSIQFLSPGLSVTVSSSHSFKANALQSLTNDINIGNYKLNTNITSPKTIKNLVTSASHETDHVMPKLQQKHLLQSLPESDNNGITQYKKQKITPLKINNEPQNNSMDYRPFISGSNNDSSTQSITAPRPSIPIPNSFSPSSNNISTTTNNDINPPEKDNTTYLKNSFAATIWDVYRDWYIGSSGTLSIKEQLINNNFNINLVKKNVFNFEAKSLLMKYVEMECSNSISNGRFSDSNKTRDEIRKIIVRDVDSFMNLNGMTLETLILHLNNSTRQNTSIYKDLKTWEVNTLNDN